jgi:hypothetical protein
MVMTQEPRGLLSSHVPLQGAGIGARKVHQNQHVHDSAEVVVRAAGEKFATQLEIMLEEYGDAFGVRFDV